MPQIRTLHTREQMRWWSLWENTQELDAELTPYTQPPEHAGEGNGTLRDILTTPIGRQIRDYNPRLFLPLRYWFDEERGRCCRVIQIQDPIIRI